MPAIYTTDWYEELKDLLNHKPGRGEERPARKLQSAGGSERETLRHPTWPRDSSDCSSCN